MGGGPTGLLLSILLSQYNVRHTLIERRTPEQIHSHPQAHYLNMRTMEILKHYLPNVYRHVLAQMPPVEEWEGFTFGESVLGRQIARVVHPVRSLEVGQDGNGILVKDKVRQSIAIDGGNLEHINKHKHSTVSRCSVCNPGHLAQNKFSSILLDEARRMLDVTKEQELEQGNSYILHDESVQSILENNESLSRSQAPLTVKTDQRVIRTNYVIAAEGSSSQTRNEHGDEGIMVGNAEMQHLINVHFKTSPAASKKLMERKETVGMLHFVFNSQLVGAFVCHNLQEGEWVLQIPFFPPFQKPSDFTTNKARDMVLSGLGLKTEVDGNADVDILSVKPWTMSATVARSYFIGSSNRIILAGDAAHTFPPAGGFGMNTGLQDAHNLAWRVATALRHNEVTQTEDDGGGPCKRSEIESPNILQPYETERRSIAAQNASLSVRNYNRSLDIAKACYLNADHPSLLVKVMDSPPMSFVPMSVRRQTFNTAVAVAMTPLGSLATEGNLYGEKVVRNVRKILSSGGGLPLLFPRFEINFGYDTAKSLDRVDDTAGYVPRVAVGCRLPHCSMERLHCGEDGQIARTTITITDVEAQMQERWNGPLEPRYSVVLVCPQPSELVRSMALKWAQSTQQEHILGLNLIEVYSSYAIAAGQFAGLAPDVDAATVSLSGLNAKIHTLVDEEQKFMNLLEGPDQDYTSSPNAAGGEIRDKNEFQALLLRPDGHILSISTFTL